MPARPILFAFVTCLAGVANAAAPVGKAPTGKWVVNFDDEQCVATRDYGSEDDPIYFTIKSPPIGDVVQMGIVRNGPSSEPDLIQGQVTFDQGPEIETTFLQYGVKKHGRQATLVTIPATAVDAMKVATSVDIRARGSRPILGSNIKVSGRSINARLALDHMSELMALMQDCVEDLRKVWNIREADEPSPFKRSAMGNLQSVFGSEDYPGVAVSHDMSGTVGVAMLIDEAGAVADCTVIASSGSAILDSQSCAIIKKRARFKPAIGPDDKPMKSSYSQRITWRLQ